MKSWYFKQADKAVLRYIKAMTRALAEVTQEFAPALGTYVNWCYDEMMRMRTGVYRTPPRSLVRFTRDECDALVAIHDPVKAYLTCECFLLPRDAVYLYIALVTARRQIMRGYKKQLEDDTLSELLGGAIPDVDSDVMHRAVSGYLWEQLMKDDDGEVVAGVRLPVPARRVPFIRTRLAGQRAVTAAGSAEAKESVR